VRRHCSRPVLLALLAAHSGALTAAVAPTENQRTKSVDPAPVDLPQQPVIIVTGSRIPRRNLIEPSPVTVVDSREIKLQGTTNIEELLNGLPQVAPTQGAFLNNGANGTATVDLRDLGPSHTLVLINGRRLGPGDPSQPVADLNIIPPTLIKRVELLTGGSSSVYGSDAVAGVVNFILDTTLDGVRIDGQTSVFQHDNHTGSAMRRALDDAGLGPPSGNAVDGGRSSIDVAVGKTFMEGRGHFSAYGGYRKQQGLTQDARDYSACTAQVDPDANTELFCSGATGSSPASFVDQLGRQFHTGPNRTFDPDQLLFNFAPYNYYQRPDDRYTAGAFANVQLNDAFAPYFELMFLHDRSVAQLAPSVSNGHASTINCDNPLLSSDQRAFICTSGNYAGEEGSFIDDDGNVVIVGTPTEFDDPVTGGTYLKAKVLTRWRNVEGGARQQDISHKTFRLVGGAKGDIAKGVTYDASYLQTKASFTQDDRHFLSASRLRNALDVVSDPATGNPACRSALTADDPDCVPWDLFNSDGVGEAAIAYLDASAHLHGSVAERVANANSTIDLGILGLRTPWSIDSPSVNLGAEYRKDRLVYVPDPQQFTGNLAGAGQAQLPVDGATQVKELFAEARVPVVQDGFVYAFTLEAGYRASWYSNSQSKVWTDAWKLAADLSPVRGLRFRGSLQRAVRAPNIVELFTPVVDGVLFDDPCAGRSPEATFGQCQLTGVTAAQYGHIAKLPDSELYQAIVGGNPALEPERSRTKTIGMVLEPRFIPGLSATVDWWDILVKGAVQGVGADLTMETCLSTGDPFFCSRIHRDSSGSLWLTPEGFVDDRLINIAAFKLRGVDVGVDYHHGLGAMGAIGLNFVGSYTGKWSIQPGGLAESFDCAGLFGGGCAIPTPRWRHKARITWTSRSGITLSGAWRYSAELKLTPNPDFEAGPFSNRIGQQSFFDLAATAQIDGGKVFRLGVNNIFDREPPLVPSGEGACGGGCNGNTYPQWYDPLGRFIFAGVTLDLKPL